MASEQLHRGVELSPTCETRHGVEVFWQIPEHPKAILFIAHGGRGRPSSYWDVEGHQGLPQHKAVTQYALEKGYAVITIESVDHGWSHLPADSSPDISNVEKILNEWRGENAKLKDLHLTVLGSASGGEFVSVLALKLKVFSAVLVVSAGSEEAFRAATKDSYPPTLFVHLTHDDVTNNKVKEEIQTLHSKGIPTAEVVSEPVPITPTTFSDNIEGFDQELARKLHEALLSNHVINEAGFIVKRLDPPEAHKLLHSLNILPEDDSEGAGHRGRGHHGHRGHRAAAEEGAAEIEDTEHRRFGPGRGHRGPLPEGEEGRPHRFGPGRRRRGAAGGAGAENEGGAEGEGEAELEEVLGEEHKELAEGHVTEGEAGAEAEPQAGAGRGHRQHGVGRGQGHGHGHRFGHQGPHRGPPLKWERQVKSQLFVAEGLHGLTSNKSHEIFDWLEGKTWNTKSSV